MKKKLKQALFVELIIVMVLGIGLVSISKAGLTTISAKKVNHSPGSPNDSAWDKISATKITLGANELVGGHGRLDLSDNSQIEVKAAYNNTDLFMYFKWKDSTYDNYHSYWEFNGTEWSLNETDEDRLYLMWPITDVAGRDGKTFTEAKKLIPKETKKKEVISEQVA